ncbi:hypothetical protein HBI52_113540 [Parastagonospora nodorum]|nr:hypothetical protein HBI79_114190 [Parastagonospora nodorum]KAH5514250.1 hypothetical protein HBI52_113540 [Parastagonospora nodorum]
MMQTHIIAHYALHDFLKAASSHMPPPHHCIPFRNNLEILHLRKLTKLTANFLYTNLEHLRPEWSVIVWPVSLVFDRKCLILKYVQL